MKSKFFKPKLEKNEIVSLIITSQKINIISGDKSLFVDTPKDAFSEGVIIKTHEVAQAIKNLLILNKVKNRNTIASIGVDGVLLRLLNVPFLKPEAIKDIVCKEVSKYIAFSGEELETDFYPLGDVSESGIRKLRVLAVAVKKEIIDSYIKTIKLAGLNVQVIDLNCLAIIRATISRTSTPKDITILVSVENDVAIAFIFKDSQIYYLHKLDSANQLQAGLDSINKYCQSEFGKDAKIHTIISSEINGLTLAEGLSLRDSKESAFLVKINLLPLEELKTKEFDKQIVLFLTTTISVIAVLLFVFFCLLVATWFNSKQAAHSQENLKKPTPVLNKLLGMEKVSKLYEREIKNQQKIIKAVNQQDWSLILKEIKKVIPKKAFLVRIESNQDNEMNIVGEAANADTVFSFVNSLKSSDYFTDVKLVESKDKENQNNVTAYFMIKCQIAAID